MLVGKGSTQIKKLARSIFKEFFLVKNLILCVYILLFWMGRCDQSYPKKVNSGNFFIVMKPLKKIGLVLHIVN